MNQNNPVNFRDFLGLSEISDVNGGYADNGGLGYNGGNNFDSEEEGGFWNKVIDVVDITLDVVSAVLTAIDFALGGPTGEGILPALAIKATKKKVKNAVGKTGQKINLDKYNAWDEKIVELEKKRNVATTKAEKNEISRQLKHARTKQKESEPHAITGQGCKK